MRTYELLYIIPATLTDEEVAKTEGEIQALVQKYGGASKESRRLGKFKLAYLIKHVRHGHYVLAYFEAEPQAVAKINEALRISDKVLRHIILSADEVAGPFELVQYQEIVVEGASKDDRAKRKRLDKDKAVAEDVKAAAALAQGTEEKVADEAAVAVPTTTTTEVAEDLKDLSAEELDRKIDAALSENA